MMSKMKERKRAPNFSHSEELCLMQLAEQKAAIIHCKYMDSVSLEKKRKAWEEINQDFLRKCGIQRGAIKLKWKYECLRRKARKSLADIKPCCTTVGGAAADEDSNEIEYKMAALMGVSAPDLKIKFEGYAGSPMQDYPSTSAVPVEVAKNDFDVDLSACIKVESFADIKSETHSCHAATPLLLDKEIIGVLKYEPKVPTTASEAQRTYYENENRRANERHSWNREQHQREEEHWLLKSKLLWYELEAKEKELNVDN